MERGHCSIPDRRGLEHRRYGVSEFAFISSGGSRNLKTGGRSPDAVEFLSEVCFDDLSHLPDVSLVRVVNKIHFENIVC